MTARSLHPDEPHLPTVAWFAEQDLFGRRLPQDLIRDFVAKAQRSSRLEARFQFGVRYRFVSGQGVPDVETALLVLPVAQRVEEERDVPVSSTASRFHVWGSPCEAIRPCSMSPIRALMERVRGSSFGLSGSTMRGGCMTPRWCGYRVLSGRGPEGECGVGLVC